MWATQLQTAYGVKAPVRLLRVCETGSEPARGTNGNIRPESTLVLDRTDLTNVTSAQIREPAETAEKAMIGGIFMGAQKDACI